MSSQEKGSALSKKSPANESAPAPKAGNIATNTLFGFRVLLGELKWLAIKSLRALELRQLQKRLAEENKALGEAYIAQSESLGALGGDEPVQPSEEMQLAHKQIMFLQDEIAFLEKGLAEQRGEYISHRKQALGLHDGE